MRSEKRQEQKPEELEDGKERTGLSYGFQLVLFLFTLRLKLGRVGACTGKQSVAFTVVKLLNTSFHHRMQN